MKAQDLRNIANPYIPITSKLSSKQFIGREDETTRIIQGVKDSAEREDWKETSKLSSELQALTQAWNEKANNVWEEVEKIFEERRIEREKRLEEEKSMKMKKLVFLKKK